MIKTLIGLLVLTIPAPGIAQGIHFEQGLTWKQIMRKAKVEKKFIFVDCSASWCAPCKKMDREVFPKPNVGEFMNAKFVSIHVQMDTSVSDDDQTKAWYADAHRLGQQYRIKAYPTYLFFSPAGVLVHRFTAALPDSLFLKLAANALNPAKQYYVLLKRYQSGEKNYEELRYLADISRQIGADSLAKTIAGDYLHHYLDKLPPEEWMQKKYFDFIRSYLALLRSSDQFFQFIYHHQAAVDGIAAQEGFAKGVVLDVVNMEDIGPVLWPGKKIVSRPPDWSALQESIERKFDSSVARRAVIDAQITWYSLKKDLPQKMKYIVKKVDTYGLDTAGIAWALTNNTVFDLFFKYCNDRDTLSKVIRWMELINALHPNDFVCMDTQANLLYKLGRKAEAIALETQAVALETVAARENNKVSDPLIHETLEKMQRGEPTW